MSGADPSYRVTSSESVVARGRVGSASRVERGGGKPDADVPVGRDQALLSGPTAQGVHNRARLVTGHQKERGPLEPLGTEGARLEHGEELTAREAN